MADQFLSTGGENNGGTDPALEARVQTLEDNELKVTYYVEINASSGTITPPAGATILLNQYPGNVDAYVSTIDTNAPTGDNPVTAGGAAVDVSSFDASGNFVLTGTPSAYPVALIFVFKISAADWTNVDLDQIIDYYKIASTYQDVYDASAVTKTLTNSSKGAVKWQRGSAADTDNVFEILNGAGTVKNWITGEGVTYGNKKRSNGGNAAYSITALDQIVYTGTAFTAARIWTLPDASTVTAGTEIIVTDQLQTVTSTNTLTIAVQTGQKLNGTTNGTEVMNAAGGWRRLVSDGVDGWYFDAGIARLGKTQTFAGVNTFSQAIVANSETASRVAIIDGSKNIKSADTATYPNLTELAYLKGALHPVQLVWELVSDTSVYAAPTDGATLYSGTLNNYIPETTNVYRFESPKTNAKFHVICNIFIRGTLATTETTTIKLQNITAATEETLNSITHSKRINRSVTLSTLANTAGDEMILQLTLPNFATNPTNAHYQYIIKVY